MLNEYASGFQHGTWNNWLSRIAGLKTKSAKTYDYRDGVYGVDYVFDRLNEQDGNRGYMTSQKSGVKVGDHVLLTENGLAQKYVIKELDYYSSPEDMWVALLLKLDE
jgi:hypothetical protein